MYAELAKDGRRDGSGGLSAKTIRYVHTTLHKSLVDAVDAGLLARNPAGRAKPPTNTSPRSHEMNVWTADELRTFLNHVRDDRLGAAWVLAAHSGMRRGEVLGLRWVDVDLEGHQLSVRQALVSVAYDLHFTGTKTSTGTRTIALHATTVSALTCHRVRQQHERAAWGDAYDDAGLVFARENGTPIHPDSMSQSFERHVRGAGLRRIRLHDLRHTHATLLLKAGIPLKVVSERLGHSDPGFTLRTYAHVLPGMQADAASRFADLLR